MVKNLSFLQSLSDLCPLLKVAPFEILVSLFKEYTNLKANNLMLYVENFIRTESSRIGNIATCICKRLDP